MPTLLNSPDMKKRKAPEFNINISLSLNPHQFINPQCDVTNGHPITPPVKLIYQVGRGRARPGESRSALFLPTLWMLCQQSAANCVRD